MNVNPEKLNPHFSISALSICLPNACRIVDFGSQLKSARPSAAGAVMVTLSPIPLFGAILLTAWAPSRRLRLVFSMTLGGTSPKV